jgi:NhaA family Na+:H+ antiporter
VAEPRPGDGEAGRVFWRLPGPLAQFLRLEAAGGIVLVVAAAVALVWANSAWQDSYETLWNTRLAISLGSHSLDLTLREWVNDGLMTIFFFVVGLEIKRELVVGELRTPRRAALPVVAAIGGMAVPVVLYLAINVGGPHVRGWGIPMATDIAVAVGVLGLLGPRVSPSLKLFVLALAIVDDIGAIIVIALVYSSSIEPEAMLIAAGILAVVVMLERLDVRSMAVYVVLGLAFWLEIHEGGVHATIAGVLLGLLTPTRARIPRELVTEEVLRDVSTPAAARETVVTARESVSVVSWLEYLLHPWSSLVIVPLFALANAGVRLSASALSDAATSRVAWGVLVGLVVGKLAGITVFTLLSVRLGLGVLPDGMDRRHVIGAAALGGIGFTVSLFVTALAFDDVAVQDQAKIGILAASIVAACLGAVVLRATSAPASISAGGNGPVRSPPHGRR